jgi:hypothetical protein
MSNTTEQTLPTMEDTILSWIDEHWEGVEI